MSRPRSEQRLRVYPLPPARNSIDNKLTYLHGKDSPGEVMLSECTTDGTPARGCGV